MLAGGGRPCAPAPGRLDRAGQQPPAQRVALGPGVDAIGVQEPRRAGGGAAPVHELHRRGCRAKRRTAAFSPVRDAAHGGAQDGGHDQAAGADGLAGGGEVRRERAREARIVVRAQVEHDGRVIGPEPRAQHRETLRAPPPCAVVDLGAQRAEGGLQVRTAPHLQAVTHHQHVWGLRGGRRGQVNAATRAGTRGRTRSMMTGSAATLRAQVSWGQAQAVPSTEKARVIP